MGFHMAILPAKLAVKTIAPVNTSESLDQAEEMGIQARITALFAQSVCLATVWMIEGFSHQPCVKSQSTPVYERYILAITQMTCIQG